MIKLKNIEYLFVLLIPIINAITPILITPELAGTGFHAGYIRSGILFSFIIYFFLKRFIINKVSIFVSIFFVYMFILALLSSDTTGSIRYLISVIITMAMLPIGYYYFKSYTDLSGLNLTLTIASAIIVIYLIYANIFQLGVSVYLDETFYTGNLSVNITKILSVYILITPILLSFEKKYRWLVILVASLSLIFVLIGLKRSALLAGALGLIVYTLLAPRKWFVIKVILSTSIILLVLSTFFLSTFIKRWEARQMAIEATLDVRGTYEERVDRLGEFIDVTNLVLGKGPKEILFGISLFDHVGVIEGRGQNRPLHVDYSVFLYGSGIIGLGLFLFIYLIAHWEKKKFYTLVTKSRYIKEMNAVFYALIISGLVMSIAGSWGAVGLRSFIFLYLGAIIGVIRETAKNQMLKTT